MHTSAAFLRADSFHLVMRDEIFLPFELTHGDLARTAGDAYRSRLSAWRNTTLDLPDDGTHFGYVHEATATLKSSAGTFTLGHGMYFAVPSNCSISGTGQGIVITSLDYHGVFSIGGPIEQQGRLRYIDGCTDSLLIPPQIAGDPCLNALYFPAHISQTEHTHPSTRIGLVVRGAGICRTPETSYSLFAGRLFVIRANGQHSFATSEEEMVVVAFHPDSDYGPTDEVHPMINRTIVKGVPASKLDSIRTRKTETD